MQLIVVPARTLARAHVFILHHICVIQREKQAAGGGAQTLHHCTLCQSGYHNVSDRFRVTI